MSNLIKRVHKGAAPNVCNTLKEFYDKLDKLNNLSTVSGTELGLMIFDIPQPTDAPKKSNSGTTPYLVFGIIDELGNIDIGTAASFELLPCPPYCNDVPTISAILQ